MSGEKTEEPTQKKLDDIRKKGQVAQSQDVHKLFVTVVGFEIIVASKDNILIDLSKMFFSNIDALGSPFKQVLGDLVKESLYIGFKSTLIIIAAVVVARMVSGWIQFGFLMTPQALVPSLNKLNPINGVKQIFSTKKIVELLLNIAKCVIIFSVFYMVVIDSLSDIILSSTGNISLGVEAGSSIFIFASRLCIAFLLTISIFDFLLQRHFFIKQNKMSKDDIFREYKQAEGDPQTKSERKALGREIVNSNSAPVKKVDEANAVVVNPTHFAVALKYVPGEDSLPVVLCKGVDGRASEIISRAYKNNTPVIRYVWLARTLYSTAKEGRFIPKQALKPTAAVYRSIFEMLEGGEDFTSSSTVVLDQFKKNPQ